MSVNPIAGQGLLPVISGGVANSPLSLVLAGQPAISANTDLDRLRGPAAFEEPSPIGIMAVGGTAVSHPKNYALFMAGFRERWRNEAIQPQGVRAPHKIKTRWPFHFNRLRPDSIVRQIFMLAGGTVSEVEDPIIRLVVGFSLAGSGSIPFLPAGLQGAVAVFVLLSVLLRAGFPMPITGRGGLRYLAQLGLLDYDFSGKKVLDLGCGGSFFASLVNFVYGSTGAKAVGLDIQFPPRSRLGVKADANSLPFADDLFDLVTNNWLFCHYYGLNAGVSMLEEMIRVTRPGGRVSIGFSTTNRLEPMTERLKGHPAVADIFQGPIFGLTRSLSILLNNPKPTTSAMRDYYSSLEAEGRYDVPWLNSALSAVDCLPFMEGLKNGGAAERVEYVRWLRRFANMGKMSEVDVIETLEGWMSQHASDEFLRVMIATFFMERGEAIYRQKFKSIWSLLTNDERNMAMRLWLSSGEHWGRLRGMHRDYFDLPADFAPDVEHHRREVAWWIDFDCEVMKAYFDGKMNRRGG